MAKGNDGNYLQHSVEVAIALHLAKLSTQGALHLALTHGMAPFEPCDAPLVGQSRGLLRTALEAAQSPPTPGEAPIITAYRATKASLDRYPNTGELLPATAVEIGSLVESLKLTHGSTRNWSRDGQARVSHRPIHLGDARFALAAFCRVLLRFVRRGCLPLTP